MEHANNEAMTYRTWTELTLLIAVAGIFLDASPVSSRTTTTRNSHTAMQLCPRAVGAKTPSLTIHAPECASRRLP